MNRLELVNKLCKMVGIARADEKKQYLSKAEMLHLITWVEVHKEGRLDAGK